MVPPLPQPDPAAEFTKLLGALPIALLPVRIETRFFLSQLVRNELRVRIYPDEITADVHEPALTSAELSAAQAYWRAGWNPASEQDAWRSLVARYPTPRAAWIVLQTTPANLSSRPSGVPAFPQVPLQPQRWTRAAQARVLPDRWIVACYRGGREFHRVVSTAINDPLALTVNPSATPDQLVDVSGDGLTLDTDSAWTVDFNQAEKAGMAVRIPLAPDDIALGFDRLLVVGVKASLSPADSAKRLEALIDAHHYTRGFAFVGQGTATNNTDDTRSGYPPPDSGGQNSFPVERGPALNRAGGSGSLFTNALGLNPAIAAHVAGADVNEQDSARAMNDAVWPSTLGYFLEHIMEPVFSANAISQARSYFVENVRGRGPLPAFRVGATPYAIVPVSSVARWTPAPGAVPAESPILSGLRTLLPIWLQATGGVPRVGRTGDPDTDLLQVLGMDASTREVRIRQALGPEFQVNLSAFLGIDFTPWFAVQKAIATSVLSALGHPEWNPRIVSMNFGDRAFLFNHPLVTAAAISEDQGLDPNYIQALRLANSVSVLRSRPTANTPLLFLMLRQAALAEYARIASNLLVTKGVLAPNLRREFEFMAIGTGTQARQTVWQRFDTTIPNVTGALSVGDYLLTSQNSDTEGVKKFRGSLAAIENQPTAELERLFTESLDCCSHRLDAWITALASSRLQAQRSQQPLGVNLGAYGWVEGLGPIPASAGPPIQSGSGGYVQAPSMAHAAAAAVLRNGWLTRSGDNRARYAVDLSSARVRAALVVLDGVREGQSLGALFGYQFERGLHEGHAPLQLDKYIDIFRNLYPLVANKTSDSGQPAETVAARNVVDGLQLRVAWTTGAIPFGAQGLPANRPDGTPTPERAAIEQELRALDATADGLADLLLAESVYQVVKGNTTAAAASLDSVGQGMRPPSPEIAEQPRGGTSLTHRLAVVLGGDPLAAGPWSAIPATARSTAEPYLDHWAGKLIGNPANFRARASYPDPTPGDPAHRTQLEVKLSDLQLRPLDILPLARAATAQGRAAELDVRVAWFVLKTAPAGAAVQIDYTAAATWDRKTIRTFPELIEIAQAINAVIGGSRPLAPADLLPAPSASQASGADPMATEIAQRAATALQALTSANNALATAISTLEAAPPAATPDLTPLRSALLRVALFGIPAAIPATRKGSTPALRAALLDQAQSIQPDASLRATQAASAAPVDAIRTIFGRDFVVLPRFRPAASAELAQALAYGPTLTGGADAVRKWFQQAAPVHAPLARWRKMSLYAHAAAGSGLTFEAVQLPHDPAARWAALPFNGEANRPTGGRLSLILHRAVAPAATAPWTGLMLHEWSEIIPSQSEQTAVAFHYDDPGAEAPQAILLAVSPTGAATWDFDSVAAILQETLDLAKIRGVDSELLGRLGQVFPAVYVAENAQDDTIGVNFSQMRGNEAQIVSS
jgi:hypothetical protein